MYWDEVLEKYKLTKVGIARKMGVTRGSICTISAPGYSVKLNTIVKYCHAIGCSVKEVLFGEDYLTFHVIYNKDYYFATTYAELEELFRFIPVKKGDKVHLTYEDRHLYDTLENLLVKAKEYDLANKA